MQGRVWSVALNDRSVDRRSRRRSDLRDHTTALGGATTLGSISSFGVDAAGELYIVGYSRGMIFKIAGLRLTPRAARAAGGR